MHFPRYGRIVPSPTTAAAPPTFTALTSPPAFLADQTDFYAIAAESAKITKPFTYGPNVNVAYPSYNDAFGKTRGRAEVAQVLARNTTVKDLALYDRDLEEAGDDSDV